MMTIRRSHDRGTADHGWLHSQHTFSFAGYVDPKHMNFGPLRVINEDRIQGGTGFDKHPHKDMEIISYVISGSLEHEDTMGNKAVIRPGEVQVMSAGSGVMHSEMNHEPSDETHFFQIWIVPDVKGKKPSYGQNSFSNELAAKTLVLVASRDGREGSISIGQNADMYISRIAANTPVQHKLGQNRGVWVQVVKGVINIGDNALLAGDGAAITDVSVLNLTSSSEAEFILFDLPMTPK